MLANVRSRAQSDDASATPSAAYDAACNETYLLVSVRQQPARPLAGASLAQPHQHHQLGRVPAPSPLARLSAP